MTCVEAEEYSYAVDFMYAALYQSYTLRNRAVYGLANPRDHNTLAFVKATTRMLLVWPDATLSSLACNTIHARKMTVNTKAYLSIYTDFRFFSNNQDYFVV